MNEPRTQHTSGLEEPYTNLITLWTSGVRDYHSLLSDYLTANSIFVAAIGLLARQSSTAIFTLLVLVLCLFGVLMALQMAIVLGRFSAQNALWEWRLRELERTPGWNTVQLFEDLHKVRDLHETLRTREHPDSSFPPNWAVRQHRQWWARREISFPLFFGIVYALFLIWALGQLL
jgi:hypothetical protein